MAVTAVELSAESCVLVLVRSGGDRVQVSTVRRLAVDDWDSGRTLAQNLAEARRVGRFPRKARVVAWGLHESAGTGDPLTKSVAAPLREAGFSVDTVISPARALVLLAHRHPRPAGRDAAAWLAINRHGAAVAIVAAGELLYSREIAWHYREAGSVKAELLQRYSLVSHLAPEVQHALDLVEAERGVRVNAIMTCGDLPDLRSLTMPLIEELDIEVETLDTLEWMDRQQGPEDEDPAASAPALCLAAIAGAGGAPGRRAEVRSWLAAAAAIVLLVAAGWVALRTVRERPAGDVTAAPAARTPAPATPRPRPENPLIEAPRPAQAPMNREQVTAAPGPPPERPAPPLPPDASRPAATMGRDEATRPARSAPNRARPLPAPGEPLPDPLPEINSILVAPDRRLAVVAGEIVREGDAVGRRVLIRIEPDALVLREPSGREIRAPIRRRPG
jgi:hypothetical protein